MARSTSRPGTTAVASTNLSGTGWARASAPIKTIHNAPRSLSRTDLPPPANSVAVGAEGHGTAKQLTRTQWARQPNVCLHAETCPSASVRIVPATELASDRKADLRLRAHVGPT